MFIGLMMGIVAFLVLGIIVMVVLIMVKPDLFAKNKNTNGDVVSVEDIPQKAGMMAGQTLGDTKRFNPVMSFEERAMDLGNHNYRAVVEVSSVNYGLLSANEQIMIENNYHNFLNSLDFPIEIYIQTREFDMDLMMDNLEVNISKSTKKFKDISEYAKNYKNSMQNVTEYIRNSKIKKKYIIVSYNNTDLSDVSALTHYEIKEFALDELMNRCRIVVSGINSLGLNATILDKSEVAEVVYSYFHRDAYRIALDIMRGEFDSLAVEGKVEKASDKRTILDEILNSCQNRVKTQLISADSTPEEIEYYNYIYSVFEYFKQNDRSSFIGDLIEKTYPKAVEKGNGKEFTDYIRNHPEKMDLSNFDTDTTKITPNYLTPDLLGETETTASTSETQANYDTSEYTTQITPNSNSQANYNYQSAVQNQYVNQYANNNAYTNNSYTNYQYNTAYPSAYQNIDSDANDKTTVLTQE